MFPRVQTKIGLQYDGKCQFSQICRYSHYARIVGSNVEHVRTTCTTNPRFAYT
jgi:hypothetical protein